MVGAAVTLCYVRVLGQGAGSASLQTRYGAGIGREPVKAKCLQVRVF